MIIYAVIRQPASPRQRKPAGALRTLLLVHHHTTELPHIYSTRSSQKNVWGWKQQEAENTPLLVCLLNSFGTFCQEYEGGVEAHTAGQVRPATSKAQGYSLLLSRVAFLFETDTLFRPASFSKRLLVSYGEERRRARG